MCLATCVQRCKCVCVCVYAYEYEPLAVIHREDMLTGLSTTERIGRKLHERVCVCFCERLSMCTHVYTPSCVCLCVCVRSH